MSPRWLNPARMWLWAGGAGVVLFLAAVLWLQFGGVVSRWWRGVDEVVQEGQATVDEIRAIKEQLAKSEGERAQLNRAIAELARGANDARRRADEAEARAAKWAGEVATLRSKIQELEAARRALVPVTSAEEAAAALRELGYPAEVRR